MQDLSFRVVLQYIDTAPNDSSHIYLEDFIYLTTKATVQNST